MHIYVEPSFRLQKSQETHPFEEIEIELIGQEQVLFCAPPHPNIFSRVLYNEPGQ